MAAERNDAINAAIDHAAGYVAYRSSRVGAFLGMLKEHGFTVAALAAQPSAEPGLDVERLAMAMADGILRWQSGSVLEHRATRFRRAYAALAPDRPTPA